MEPCRKWRLLTITLLTMFLYKYVCWSCCLDGNNGVALGNVCVTVMCGGLGSNPILKTFYIQMRCGPCPEYNCDSIVVQLNIKFGKNAMAPKLPSAKTFRCHRCQKITVPKRLGAKTPWRKNVLAQKRRP